MKVAVVALASLASLAVALPSQFPFTSANAPSLPKPKADFEILTHPEFEDHRVRIRSPKGLCDDVEQKSGYLDTPNGRYDLEVVLWLNGGPGCSSFTGLLQELGPCRVQKEGVDPIKNPYSWNSNASLIFLDQPVGVGYSYAGKDDKGVWSTGAAAEDVYAFLSIFFEAFKEKYGNVDFHIAGESYAGRYIPLFADYIVLQNAKANNVSQIPLKSVLVGNGFTNPKIQYAAYYPTVCTNETGYGPYVSKSDCAKMADTLPRCQALVQKCYDDPSNSAVCLSANLYCESTQTEYYYQTGRNPYDMLRFGDYDEEAQIHHFLNRDDVRHELGVDAEEDGGVKEFIGCSDIVGYRFAATGDQAQASYPKVAHFIDNGVAALFYAGKADFICNWLGNQAWTLDLEWSGQAGFNAEPLRPWYANATSKDQAGVYRQYGNLAFAVVDDSGHFVPYDHPVESLAMFNGWIHGRDFWTRE
ncbi:cathepsin A (carboxypeptidase C) [Pseudohyphozyma bogoriensis]|nr:cathepsin A (carboxypeptidase C) [Pseudohyphozyma bogoriensis]